MAEDCLKEISTLSPTARNWPSVSAEVVHGLDEPTVHRMNELYWHPVSVFCYARNFMELAFESFHEEERS